MKNEIIDQLLNPTDKNKNVTRDIIVPNAIQGKTGEVGTILFVNHKKEIIEVTIYQMIHMQKH